MSEIPYSFFAIPTEFFTDDFLDDIFMMKLIRYIFKRIKTNPHTELLQNNNALITIDLAPYDFVFGREMAAKECGCSEKMIRTRIHKLRASSYLEEISLDSISKNHFSTVRASSWAGSSGQKRASTFTVYRLTTKAFKQNKGQQLVTKKGQQLKPKKSTPEYIMNGTVHSEGQQLGHNIDNIDNIERTTTTPTPSSKEEAVAAVFSNEKDSNKQNSKEILINVTSDNICSVENQQLTYKVKNKLSFPARNEDQKFIFDCLRSLSDPSISEEDKIQISKKYIGQEQRVADAVKTVTTPGFKTQVSLLKSLWSACKGGWKPSISKEIYAETNKKLAQLIEEVSEIGRYSASPSHLEVNRKPGQVIYIDYNQTLKDFCDQIEKVGNIKLKSNARVAKFLSEITDTKEAVAI